jgi:hypothetical protein
LSPFNAARATLALKLGVWFLLFRLVMICSLRAEAPRRAEDATYREEKSVQAMGSTSTSLATSVDLLGNPLGTIVDQVWDVGTLVAAVLLASVLWDFLKDSLKLSDLFRHAAIVTIAALLSEAADSLIGNVSALSLPASSKNILEFGEAALFAGLFWVMCLIGRRLLASGRVDRKNNGSEVSAGYKALLPSRLRERVTWMKAEGNYIAVHCGEEQRLIKYVFSRAVKENQSLGLRVHRSFWVASDHIDDLQTIKGRPMIITKNNERIPVSRTYRMELEKVIFGS